MSSLHCECVGPCQTLFKDSSPHPSPFSHSHNSPLTHIRHNQTAMCQSHQLARCFRIFCFSYTYNAASMIFIIMLYHLISVHNFHSLFALGRRVFRGCMHVISNEVTRRTNTVQQPMALSDSFVYLITGCWCIF